MSTTNNLAPQFLLPRSRCLRILVPWLTCLILSCLIASGVSASQTDIAGPAGSGTFGESVTVLPNGNIVVVDSAYDEGGITDVGAVYLYDGATLALISKLTGESNLDAVGNLGVKVLANGNFVVSSPFWNNPSPAIMRVGAVTWCSAVTGCNGKVSSANSIVGTTAIDMVGSGITILTNGNYVIASIQWDNPAPLTTDVGAVTWGNGTTGTAGVITPANSLVGLSSGDSVGSVQALANGNYVVASFIWDNPLPAITDVGAVTWGNGTSGTVGFVSAGNSLIGGSTNDLLGGVIPLTNGNYVASSSAWDNPSVAMDAGAVTWCNGLGGTVGLVTSSNSLVGNTPNQATRVGYTGITALTNGNYVVSSPLWRNPSAPTISVGAVTWGNGATGTSGEITSANSLIGSHAGDLVSNNGVTALNNGNYVVRSAEWDYPSPLGLLTDSGAVTWGNGAGGTVGFLTSSNSLVGAANSFVGGGGVTALTNGNYVVRTTGWSLTPMKTAVGAVTWGNGSSGTAGLVTSSNSLVGNTTNDQVGNSEVRALANGNYIVSSTVWDNVSPAIVNAGAVTWGNGLGGTVGLVTASNSLVGSVPNDSIGQGQIFPLSNGNYLVSSPVWDNPSPSTANVGAVTWGNGLGGTVGPITAGNSLIGGTSDDFVGSNALVGMTNGNYVVSSPSWNNPAPLTTDVGAVTWGNGALGSVGVVTSSNSLVGATSNDQVGNGQAVTALLNGNYVVRPLGWFNPSGSIITASAVTYGNGAKGTSGPITSANSVLGTARNGTSGFTYDAVRNRLFVGRAASNLVTVLFFNTTAITDGNLDNAATWDNGVPDALTNVVIPAGRTVTVNSPATIGSLDLQAGGALVMNANLDLAGNLSLGATVNTGASTLGLKCSSAISGAGSSNYIIGNLKKDFCAMGPFTFPTGTANGYSPVNANLTSLVVSPASLTIKANQVVQPLLAANGQSNTSLQRYWTLNGSGLRMDLTFNYLAGDVMGIEPNYRIIRVSGSTSVSFPSTAPDIVNHKATVSGVSSFSDWTVGEVIAPTAANGVVTGRIVDDNGVPVEGAVVRLAGTQSRKFITDANGFYRFENVETTGFYIVTPSRANYTFNPSSRSFSQIGDTTEATFGATLATSTFQNPLDTAEYFVRQNYIDFLGREPDESGFNFWSDQILSCGNNTDCVSRKRENVSAAYFLSIEFQRTGGLVDGLYRAAYGDRPNYAQFMPDTRTVGRGVVVGVEGWEAKLAANKEAFVNAFVNRPAFAGVYGNMGNSEYVDALISRTGVSFTASERDALLSGLGTGTMTRAEALRSIAENNRFANAKFNEAFVMMEYFGYLRRDADVGGFAFWLNKLNEFDGNFERAEMVKAFIVSGEYRDRFPR